MGMLLYMAPLLGIEGAPRLHAQIKWAIQLQKVSKRAEVWIRIRESKRNGDRQKTGTGRRDPQTLSMGQNRGEGATHRARTQRAMGTVKVTKWWRERGEMLASLLLPLISC